MYILPLKYGEPSTPTDIGPHFQQPSPCGLVKILPTSDSSGDDIHIIITVHNLDRNKAGSRAYYFLELYYRLFSFLIYIFIASDVYEPGSLLRLNSIGTLFEFQMGPKLLESSCCAHVFNLHSASGGLVLCGLLSGADCLQTITYHHFQKCE